MPLFFCDVCGREVPAAQDGTCRNPDCVNTVLQQERDEEPGADDPTHPLGPDLGGEG